MTHHLIIALPNRLLAQALAEYVQAKGDVMVCGIATESKEIFELLNHPLSPSLNKEGVAERSEDGGGNMALLYDPYLPGPGPEVLCCRLKREYAQVNVILLKGPHANGQFEKAANCRPAAVISSEANLQELLTLIKKVNSKRLSVTAEKNVPLLNYARSDNTEHQLSQRELQVAELVAKGLCARSIADELKLSWFTVRTHLDNIRKKLNLNNKAQITSWYLSTEIK